MKSIITAIVASCTAVLGASAQENTTYVHVGNVLLIPGEGYQQNKTIVVREGKIDEIADGFVETPEGVDAVDLKESYVVPGLIDSHVHLLSEFSPTSRLKALTDSEVDSALEGASYAKKTLLSGFTTVQDVGGANEAIFSLRDAIAKGYVAGPRIRASGSAVTPTGGHGDANGFSPAITRIFSGGNACNGADDCRRAVRETIKSGADIIKITATGGVLSNTAAGLEQQFFDDELKAIVDTAATMGRKVTAHAHGKTGIESALKAGVQSIEHGTYLDRETIKLFKKYDATLVPTVLAGVTVTGWTQEPWLPAPSRAKAAEVGPLMLDMLRLAKEGGVNIAFGTDTGVSKHGDNAQEFGLMVEAGFTPEEAIRAATVIAAKHIELYNEIGSLEEGKAADMIALDADPLADIDELLDVDFVMKGGKVFKS